MKIYVVIGSSTDRTNYILQSKAFKKEEQANSLLQKAQKISTNEFNKKQDSLALYKMTSEIDLNLDPRHYTEYWLSSLELIEEDNYSCYVDGEGLI